MKDKFYETHVDDGMRHGGLVSTKEERRVENMEAALHAYRREAESLRGQLTAVKASLLAATDALASERSRRLEAEKVIDALDTFGAANTRWQIFTERCRAYRLRFPKDLSNG